jgi:hypothetical protein
VQFWHIRLSWLQESQRLRILQKLFSEHSLIFPLPLSWDLFVLTSLETDDAERSVINAIV